MIVPNCRELIEFLDDYVDRRLPLSKRLAFELHLAMCRDCRNYLASYRRTMELAREAGDAEDNEPAPMPEDLVRAILDTMKRGNGNDSDGPAG